MGAWGFRDSVTGFAVTDRLTRIIGDVTLPATAGSMSVPDFALGQGWWFEYVQSLNIGTTPRNISISGTTLSWSAYHTTTRILYGVS